MARTLADELASPTLERVVDAQELRAAVAKLLIAPVDEETLRRRVWTYVGMKRHAGINAGLVIVVLTELVDNALGLSEHERQDLMRKVILWSVEAYFGHLGGDVVGRDGFAFADYPRLSSKR